MKYKLGRTRVIHWDLGKDVTIRPDVDILQRLVSADTYITKKGLLPIIIECKIIIFQGGKTVFNSILHTNCLLQFELKENPINDLMIMMKDAHHLENAEWDKHPLASIDISLIDLDTNVDLNKACEIRDIARVQNLLT